MNKKDDEKKIAQIAQRRKDKEQKTLRKEEPWKAERWFEFTELFDMTKITPLAMKGMGERMFVMGVMEDTMIITVPEDSQPATVTNALEALARRGIRALAFTDNIRFVKLKMCSPEEEEMLTEADSDGDGLVQIKWPPTTAAEAAEGARTVPLESIGSGNIPLAEVGRTSADEDPGVVRGDPPEEAPQAGPEAGEEAAPEPEPVHDFELPSEKHDRLERERREREGSEDPES
jgi:hypothetical protein